MRRFFFILVLLVSVLPLSGQSCYAVAYSDGVAAYNEGKYALAKDYFEMAEICPDRPLSNDLASWISKCQAAQEEAARQAEAARRQAGTGRKEDNRICVGNVCFDMVSVEGGSFVMGASVDYGKGGVERELPFRSAKVGDFWIGRCEVTQGLWKAVVGQDPEIRIGPVGDDYPMEFWVWDDVELFVSRLNALTGKAFRVPTEAEWEFAAKGGKKSKGYQYSGSDDVNTVAWYNGNSPGYHSMRVGQKQPNELGIYDMSGNLYEWCSDVCWREVVIFDDLENPGSTIEMEYVYRILKGGSYWDSAEKCRISARIPSDPGYRNSAPALRLVLER